MVIYMRLLTNNFQIMFPYTPWLPGSAFVSNYKPFILLALNERLYAKYARMKRTLIEPFNYYTNANNT